MAECITKTMDGQFVIEACAETGAEGIWSGSEYGTYRAWIAEHDAAHARADRERYQRRVAYSMRYNPRRFGCPCGRH
jgi:hypothetical protein